MPQRSTRIAIPVAAAAVAVGVLAACSSSPSSSSAPATASASVSAAAPAGGTSVTATETDFHIALSATAFHPGSYTFVAVNKGKTSHNLVVSGPGVNQAKTAGLISPGGQQSVTVTLQAGTYDIYCGVPGHKELGMDVHITVS